MHKTLGTFLKTEHTRHFAACVLFLMFSFGMVPDAYSQALTALDGASISAVACNDDTSVSVLVDVGGVTVTELQTECEKKNITEETFWAQVTYSKTSLPFVNGTTGHILIGQCDDSVGGVNFCLQKDGTKACVVAQETTLKSVGTCYTIPQRAVPLVPTEQAWITLPDACTKLHSPYTHSRFSLIGTITSCAEESMTTLFIEGRDGTRKPFLSVIQDKCRGVVAALLTLYVIFIGLRILMHQVFIPKEDLIWFFLRFGAVVYFALGVGMGTYTGLLLNATKGLSVMMVDASTIKSSDPTSVFSPGNPNYVGYNYCDFSTATYPAGKESLRVWDALDCRFANYLGFGLSSSACLSTGSSTASRDTGTVSTPTGDASLSSPTIDTPNVNLCGGYGFPRNLGVVILAFFSSPYSVLLSLFGAIFIFFVIGIIIRVAAVYVVSICAITILVFVSPIVIPAVLFKFTHSIFNNWLTQLIGFALQPVFLFLFVGMALTVMDVVYYGGNHYFTADGLIAQNSAGNRVMDPATNNKAVLCPDMNAPACLLERTFFGEGYPVNMSYIGGQEQGGLKLLIGFLKLALASVVLSGLVQAAEDFAMRFSGSSVALASTANEVMGPVLGALGNPALAAQGVMGATAGLAGTGGKIAGGVSGVAARPLLALGGLLGLGGGGGAPPRPVPPPVPPRPVPPPVPPRPVPPPVPPRPVPPSVPPRPGGGN